MAVQSTSNGTLLKWLVPYVLVASLQYQFTKNSLEYASPFVVMAIRYSLVGVIFYFIGGRRFSFDGDTLKIALFSSLSTIFWAFGLDYVSPGDSAVLSYTMPLFSIPLAYLIIRERISTRELSGALVGFSGVVLYAITLAHGSLLVGAILTVLNAFFWGTYSIYYRKVRARDPIPVLTTQFLVGAIPLLAGAVFFPEIKFAPGFVFDLVYVVLFTGVIQYYLWNGLLRRGRVGRITTMAFAVPATTILIDAVETSTIPPAISIAGVAVMFVGIFISTWHKGGVEASEQGEEEGQVSDPASSSSPPSTSEKGEQ